MAACQGLGPSSGGQRDIAQTPEQLVAHLDRVPAEDIRAQLTALRRVAAVRSEDPARLRQDGRLQRCLSGLEMRDVDARGFSDLAWWCGRPSSTAAAAASIAKIAQLEPQSLVNVAWSWATSHIYGQALLALICSRALAVLDEFQPLPLTNFVWSLAGLQPSGVPPPSSVAARVRTLVRQHNPQQIEKDMQAANGAWASGKACYQDEQLLEVTREQALRSMNEPDSQKLANLAWAWATLVLRKMASFKAAAAASSRLVPEPRPQHCANLAWAPARMMHVPERLSDATSTTFCQTAGLAVQSLQEVIARHVAKSPGELEARGPANLAWSRASLGQLDRSSLDLASSQLQLRTSECGPQETGTAAWSLGTLAMLGIPLMHAPGHRAFLILERLEPQNPTNLVWASGTMALDRDALSFAVGGVSAAFSSLQL
ncbi:BPM1 [Symbiodinium sp. CCMP2456]|nr:BPM1 [Symbiodinium sp. CCMP2456]